MYDNTTRERIIALLPHHTNAEIRRRTGASCMGISALRKKFGIPNPFFYASREIIKSLPEVKVTAKPSKSWPCERLKTEWRGCYHHRQCQAGHRCEAPGK